VAEEASYYNLTRQTAGRLALSNTNPVRPSRRFTGEDDEMRERRSGPELNALLIESWFGDVPAQLTPPGTGLLPTSPDD
jgi:hypothetical protein